MTMNVEDAKQQIRAVLTRMSPSELPRLMDWINNSGELDQMFVDNQGVILQNICDELRNCLPLEAAFSSETRAILKVKQQMCPTLHVDSFLYNEEQLDSLVADGRLSRSYCLNCGSQRTAPLEFISHSFSISELQFLFQFVLPDLTGKVLLDVGSRLGAVLYAGYLYSSARLLGVEVTEEFVVLQQKIIQKYGFTDRITVLHTDVCVQQELVSSVDVLVMNNVFEFFMEPEDQIKAWNFIIQTFRKRDGLLVTVPSLQEALSALQVELDPGWVEEVPLNYEVYLGREVDPEALRNIHLYRVL